MTLWLVRAGKKGEQEALTLRENVVVIGWPQLPDLAKVQDREELRTLMRAMTPGAKEARISNEVGQVWSFLRRFRTRQNGSEGDLVILPLKTRAAVAVGEVVGEYAYREDFPQGARHTRTVRWIRKDIPRSAFDQDLLFSLGAYMTVCRIQRNDAENRIRAISGLGAHSAAAPVLVDEGEMDESSGESDVERIGRDLIVKHIERKFVGHDLTRLVDAVLRAQGYRTILSPPGPDGGVDIVAGQGALGFDGPRLAVQVKSGHTPADAKTVRELKGSFKEFSADQGLFVSWGGFKQSTDERRLFFEVRMWDADDLVNAILENYERLDSDIRAELPLKQVWTLVTEDDASLG